MELSGGRLVGKRDFPGFPKGGELYDVKVIQYIDDFENAFGYKRVVFEEGTPPIYGYEEDRETGHRFTDRDTLAGGVK